MKPILVVGLGNVLMGDDGVGCRVAEALYSDPRLPAGVDVLCGGTDLLGCDREIEGRLRVVVIDAVEDGEIGHVAELPCDDTRQEHAHHLSASQAIQLLRFTTQASFTLLGVSVSTAFAQEDLSAPLKARLPEIVDRVLEELK